MSGNNAPRATGLRSLIKNKVWILFRKHGYTIDRIVPKELPQEMEATIRAAEPYTATSTERLMCLIDSINYIERYNIPGDVVECGVFRGGSIMAAALTLLSLNSVNRDLYLFDTFEG